MRCLFRLSFQLPLSAPSAVHLLVLGKVQGSRSIRSGSHRRIKYSKYTWKLCAARRRQLKMTWWLQFKYQSKVETKMSSNTHTHIYISFYIYTCGEWTTSYTAAYICGNESGGMFHIFWEFLGVSWSSKSKNTLDVRVIRFPHKKRRRELKIHPHTWIFFAQTQQQLVVKCVLNR